MSLSKLVKTSINADFALVNFADDCNHHAIYVVTSESVASVVYKDFQRTNISNKDHFVNVILVLNLFPLQKSDHSLHHFNVLAGDHSGGVVVCSVVDW